MDFDLYPAPRQPRPVKPVTTTLDALEAAEWKRFNDTHYGLSWVDHP